MTYREIRERVYTLLGENFQQPEYFNDDEVRRYINDAYSALARDSKALEVRREFLTDEDVAEYDLPDDCASIRRGYFRGERLYPLTHFELDRMDENWRNDSGEPRHYTIDNLDPRTIRLHPTPDSGIVVSFDSETGVVVRLQETGDSYQLRRQLGDFDYGVVTDYSEDSETVNFVAGTGGGADEDYGIVVDIQDADTADDYGYDSEYGVMVDLSESDDDFDDSVWIGANDSSNDVELGIIIDWEDPGNDVRFIADDYNDDATTGTILHLTVPEWRFELWYQQDPPDLEQNTDRPLLPEYSHQGIVYGAAARGLLRNSGALNPALAEVYQKLFEQHLMFLKKVVARREKEQVQVFGQHAGRRRAAPLIRLPSNYPQVRR